MFDKKSLSYTKFHKRRKYWKGWYILVHFLGQLHLASKFQNISIGNFQTSWSSCFFVFFSSKKVKYLPHLYSNHHDFEVSLPLVNIYKFVKFDPTTWRTLRTISRLCSTQKVWATQNFIKKRNDWKGRYTLRNVLL